MEIELEREAKFALSAAGTAALVGLAGAALAGPEGRIAVAVGVVVALLVQVGLFRLLFVGLFADRPLLAHGMGMLFRLAAIVIAALIWVPWAALPAAPFLFSLVAVFFVTTLLEPLFMFSFTTAR